MNQNNKENVSFVHGNQSEYQLENTNTNIKLLRKQTECSRKKCKSAKASNFKQKDNLYINVLGMGSASRQVGINVGKNYFVNDEAILKKTQKNRHINHNHLSNTHYSGYSKIKIIPDKLYFPKNQINIDYLASQMNKRQNTLNLQTKLKQTQIKQKKSKNSFKKSKSLSLSIYFQDSNQISNLYRNIKILKEKSKSVQKVKKTINLQKFNQNIKGIYTNQNEKRSQINKTYMKDLGKSKLVVKKASNNNRNLSQKSLTFTKSIRYESNILNRAYNPYKVNLLQNKQNNFPDEKKDDKRLLQQTDVNNLKVDPVAMYQIKNDVSQECFKNIQERKQNDSYDFSEHYIISKGQIYLRDDYRQNDEINICESFHTLFNSSDQPKLDNLISQHSLKSTIRPQPRISSQKNTTQNLICQVKTYSIAKLTEIKEDQQSDKNDVVINNKVNRKNNPKNQRGQSKKQTVYSELYNSKTGNNNHIVSFAQKPNSINRNQPDRGFSSKWRQFAYNISKNRFSVLLSLQQTKRIIKNKKIVIGLCTNIKISKQKSKKLQKHPRFRLYDLQSNFGQQPERKQHIKRPIINLKFHVFLQFFPDMQVNQYCNQILYYELDLKRKESLKMNKIQQIKDKLYTACISYRFDEFNNYFRKILNYFNLVKQDNGLRLNYNQLQMNEIKNKRVKLPNGIQNSKNQIKIHQDLKQQINFQQRNFAKKQHSCISCIYQRQSSQRIFVKTYSKYFLLQLTFKCSVDRFLSENIKLKIRMIHQLLNQTANLPIVEIKDNQYLNLSKYCEIQHDQDLDKKDQKNLLQFSYNLSIDKIRQTLIKYQSNIMRQNQLLKSHVNLKPKFLTKNLINRHRKRQFQLNFLQFLGKNIMDYHIFGLADEQTNQNGEYNSVSNQKRLQQKIKIIQCEQNINKINLSRDNQRHKIKLVSYKKVSPGQHRQRQKNPHERATLNHPIPSLQVLYKPEQRNMLSSTMANQVFKKRLRIEQKNNPRISLDVKQDFNQYWTKNNSLIKSTIFKNELLVSKYKNVKRKSWIVKTNHYQNQNNIKNKSLIPKEFNISRNKKICQSQKIINKKSLIKNKMSCQPKESSQYKFFILPTSIKQNQQIRQNNCVLKQFTCQQSNNQVVKNTRHVQSLIMLICSTYQKQKSRALWVVRFVIHVIRSFKMFVLEVPIQEIRDTISAYEYGVQFEKSQLHLSYQKYAQRLRLYPTYLYSQYMLQAPSYQIIFRKVVKLCVGMFVIFTIIYSKCMRCSFIKVYLNWLQKCIYFRLCPYKFKTEKKQKYNKRQKNRQKVKHCPEKNYKKTDKIVQQFTKKIKFLLKQQIEHVTTRLKIKNLQFYNMLINKKGEDIHIISSNLKTLPNCRNNKIKIRQNKNQRKSEQQSFFGQDQIMLHQELVFRFFKDLFGRQFLMIFNIPYQQNQDIRSSSSRFQFSKNKNLVKIQIFQSNKFMKFEFDWNFNNYNFNNKNRSSQLQKDRPDIQKINVDSKGIFRQILKKSVLSPMKMYKMLLQDLIGCIIQQNTKKSLNLMRRFKNLFSKNSKPTNIFSSFINQEKESKFQQIRYIKYLRQRWIVIYQIKVNKRNNKNKLLDRKLFNINMKGQQKQINIPEMGFQNLVPFPRYNGKLIKRMAKMIKTTNTR